MSNDHPRHVLAALSRRGFLISSWPWRSLAYTATTAPVAAFLGFGWAVVALPWLAAVDRVREDRPLTAVNVALMLVTGVLAGMFGPLLAVPLAAAERRRLGLVDRRPVRTAHRPVTGGVVDRLRTRFTEAATWREVAYTVVVGTVVPAAYGAVALLVIAELGLVLSPWLAGGAEPITVGFATVTSGRQAVPYAAAGLVLLVVLTPYLIGLLAAGQAAVARALLGGGDDTAVREVARSRTRLVDGYEAERRRIERDLHDGVQHRLTSLTLQLGLARLDVPDDSSAARSLATAHEQAKELMVVLRGLVHGIRPQSLAELGLPDAVRELAAQSPIPVTVTVAPQWSGRPSERVESAAYFVASEALANVAKHSGAGCADVIISRVGNHLIMEIRDDGHGGADPARGTGLTGLADRVAALDGRLLLSSPAGGPTLVRVELPCDR
ncbi:sensor histidine kinase [Planosporangium sp. 12N6]|uniref:sensor histidine kinase n=1 Tax=Planosporangium spinosum TaxID=3402278 RepID=UPI003CE8FA4D